MTIRARFLIGWFLLRFNLVASSRHQFERPPKVKIWKCVGGVPLTPAHLFLFDEFSYLKWSVCCVLSSSTSFSNCCNFSKATSTFFGADLMSIGLASGLTYTTIHGCWWALITLSFTSSHRSPICFDRNRELSNFSNFLGYCSLYFWAMCTSINVNTSRKRQKC